MNASGMAYNAFSMIPPFARATTWACLIFLTACASDKSTVEPPDQQPSDTTSLQLSLYLMGLVGPNEVQPHYVLNSQSGNPPCNSVQPATRITVAEIIAALGPRVPDHLNSPKSFSTATIVLSRERLLNADEMAFFTHMAARGEASTQLQFSSGFARGLS